MNNMEIKDGEILTDVVSADKALKLIQKKDSLLFGTDAVLLAAYIKNNFSFGAELGGGSGIISLLCAEKKKFDKIHIFEVQSELSEMIDRNIRLNGFEDKLTSHCIDIRKLKSNGIDRDSGKILDNTLCGEYCDVVFANPPYMTSNSGKLNEISFKQISRHEICGDIFDFCEAAKKLLKHGGLFYCVWRPDRLCDLMDALRKNMLEAKRMTFVCDNENTAPSMVLLEAKKGASASLFITPMLIMKKDGMPTEDARYISEYGEFNEKFRIK